jgi:hypothetical protein
MNYIIFGKPFKTEKPCRIICKPHYLQIDYKDGKPIIIKTHIDGMSLVPDSEIISALEQYGVMRVGTFTTFEQ